MKVLLIDIDSTIPNYALKKVERYHLDRGDEVIWHMALQALTKVDKIYVSCVFSKNRQKCDFWEGKADIGGSGYSLGINLPEVIENTLPRINYGFTTRGCIRHCEFCIVPQKEGKVRVVGDLLDLWDGKAKQVTLFDNNILALPEHFAFICQQARKNKIRLDFNQGLDHRLLTTEIVDLMKSISHVEYRFAFDHPSNINTVEKSITFLREQGINRCLWYVLVGFNTTPDEDLMRLNFLRDHKQKVFVQRYETHYHEPFYVSLARWGNRHDWFYNLSWDEFLKYSKGNRVGL